MIIGLHHAQITIPPGTEEAARDFYVGVLGLAEIAKPASLAGRGGFWFAVGPHCVHVGTEADIDRLATKAHLAYEVNDLKHWRGVLGARGFAVLEGVPIPGHDRFESRDPFGNRFEMIQRLADAKTAGV